MCAIRVPAKTPLFSNWELAVQRPITGNRRIYEFQHPISGDDLTKSQEWRYLGAQLTDDLCAEMSRGRVCLFQVQPGGGRSRHRDPGLPPDPQVTGTLRGTCQATTQTASGLGVGEGL